MTTVYVTNKNFKPLVVDYRGKDVSFPTNETVEIPIEAARHILGYGDNNKEPYLASLGLCLTSNEIPDGLKKLANFVIVEEAPQQDHFLSPVVEQVPLPAAKRAGGKLLSLTA